MKQSVPRGVVAAILKQGHLQISIGHGVGGPRQAVGRLLLHQKILQLLLHLNARICTAVLLLLLPPQRLLLPLLPLLLLLGQSLLL